MGGIPFYERSNPDTALVCRNGHVISMHVERLAAIPKFCKQCGAESLARCPTCGGRILGALPNVNILAKIDPPSHCTHCGAGFPWREEALNRAKRIAQMQAEIHALDASTTAEVESFTRAVAEDRVSGEEVATFIQWLRKKAGPEAAKSIGAALKDIATSVVADVIKKAMFGG